MPQITFQISSKVDVNQILSAKDMKGIFLAGLPLDKLDLLDDSTYDFYINAATDFIEQQLTIKLNKTIISEDKDFGQDDFTHWGFIQASYPAVVAVSLNGYFGETLQVKYPKQWLSCRSTSDDKLYSRQIYIVPAQNSAQSNLLIYSGLMPNAGFFGANRTIPQYWKLSYVTGFDNIPQTIVQAIGMVATIQMLGILSDLIVKGGKNLPGIGFGVSSKSISLDGLSQNSGTYLNGNNSIFGARIKQMSDQLMNPEKGLLESLRQYYGGIILGSA